LVTSVWKISIGKRESDVVFEQEDLADTLSELLI
jgi:hypothetical protein